VDLVAEAADQRVDILDIPFADGTWDIILCNHVLEHVDDDGRAMRELYRVMAPGGWALLLVPFRPDRPTDEDPGAGAEERIRRFGQHDHVRLYGRDYPDRLRAAGFAIEQEVVAERFDPAVVRYYGLYSDEVFFVGRKAP
jgi:SAM-dependent methyltransferase